MQIRLTILVLLLCALPASATNWFVRQDGGTLYNASTNPTGGCNGKADAAYTSGTNQPCAVSTIVYLYLNGAGGRAWVISGGDTVVVRSCGLQPGESGSPSGKCRLGWPNGDNSGGSFCASVSDCSMPPPPNGSSPAHTIIEGGCAFDGNCTPVMGACVADNTKCDLAHVYPYSGNLAQLFGGFGMGGASQVIDLSGAQYVDFIGLEITSHNGACTRVGTPAYPAGCNTFPPSYSDYASNGFRTSNTTSHVSFTDIYLHGMNSSGLIGPIGGPISFTRVIRAFNTFAAENFDDGSDTPNGAGSSVTANYVLDLGNGCLEEYPITHTAFPCLTAYDSSSGGFGDTWSGQDATMDSFTCYFCLAYYNTKDAFIGPHTAIGTLSITHSVSVGNMGQSWKWGGTSSPNNVTFQNNLTVGNCNRMSQPLSGAPSTYNQYLSNFCRAAGNVVASDISAGSTWDMGFNTWVFYQPTLLDIACPPGHGPPCTSTVNFHDNAILGYVNASQPSGGATPAVCFIEDGSINVSGANNTVFGVRNTSCITTSTADPLLTEEPAQGSIPPESALDAILSGGFYPAPSSPLIAAGNHSLAPGTDYYNAMRPNPPSVGAVEPLGSPIGGSVSLNIILQGTLTK